MPSRIQHYRNRFLAIEKNCNGWVKNQELKNLMTSIEEEFGIPAQADKEFSKANPVVMALYTDVSNARDL